MATTRMRAPVSSSPPIFGSPTLPAPTTRHSLPANFMNIGNKLFTDFLTRLPLRRAPAPPANLERLRRQVRRRGARAIRCHCGGQRTGADFPQLRARPDTGAAAARWPRELQSRRSGIPPAALLTD